MQQLELTTDVRSLVEMIWQNAGQRGASDVHVEPTSDGYEIRLRVDGMLETAQTLPRNIGRSVVLRMMVLAHLLTYRLDVPQEGRVTISSFPLPPGHRSGERVRKEEAINIEHPTSNVELRNFNVQSSMLDVQRSLNLSGSAVSGDLPTSREIEARVSIMPTVHGLRAAVRLPAAACSLQLDQLGFDKPIIEHLRRFCRADSGLLIVTGPAGAGKTTTIYALLAHLAARQQGLSIISLEDPVERAIAGVTQIEVKPFGQLTYERALRSILRQDPQVLMLGEIRDSATAQLAVQAAMSGHRLISTLHASTAAGAIARLLEMGIEPYQLTGSLWGVLAQRLVRLRPQSLEDRTRTAIGELLLMDADLRQAILDRADAHRLAEVASAQIGFVGLRDGATRLMQQGLIDQAELIRAFGECDG